MICGIASVGNDSDETVNNIINLEEKVWLDVESDPLGIIQQTEVWSYCHMLYVLIRRFLENKTYKFFWDLEIRILPFEKTSNENKRKGNTYQILWPCLRADEVVKRHEQEIKGELSNVNSSFESSKRRVAITKNLTKELLW